MEPTHRRHSPTGLRIVIVGTGGQGVLTAARLLCDGFVEHGHEVVSGQLHGMAQRGGSVQSSVLIDCGISPVIGSGRADLLVGFEPVETVRALGLVSSRTVVYMNTTPVIPFVVGQQSVSGGGAATYPALKVLEAAILGVTSHLCSFNATGIAEACGSVRALNMVMLGCLLGSGLLPCEPEAFWGVAGRRLPAALSEVNTKAFNGGVVWGPKARLCEARP